MPSFEQRLFETHAPLLIVDDVPRLGPWSDAIESAAADGQVVLSGRRLEALVRHLSQRCAPLTANGPGGPLTERECEVLHLLAAGASTPSIAEGMLISPHTARTHVQNVLVKLGVHSRLEAAAYAVRNNLLTSA